MVNHSSRLLLYKTHWSHFSKVSGFESIGREITKNQGFKTIEISRNSVSKIGFLFFKILVKTRVIKGREKQFSPFNDQLADYIANNLLRHKSKFNKIIFLAGEDQLTLSLLQNKEIKSKMILFLHQPVSWYKFHNIRVDQLNDIFSIIVLSSEQKKFFLENTNSKVIQIKHGVDLNFFKTLDYTKRIKNQILFVGQYLRDFDLLERTIEILLEDQVEFKLICVVPVFYRKDNLLRLARYSNVTLLDSIPEIELLDLYQKSSVLFMPLIDSTANNAINEAMACGTPIVVSDVGGVRDYLNDEIATIVPGYNPENFAKSLQEILNVDNQEKSLSMRFKAEETLNWSEIAKELNFHLG